MASRLRKKSISSPTTPKTPLSERESNVPNAIRFPLAVLINLSLSTILFTLASNVIGGDLATASRAGMEWWEILGLVGCRILELAIGWFGGFDEYDVAALTLLMRFPLLYLLTSFYMVRSPTAIVSLAIDMACTFVPFSLLRKVAPAHSISAPRGSVANRVILNDLTTQTLVSALAAGSYALVYSLFSWTRLPGVLAVNFDGLRNISAAYESNFVILFATFLPLGFAAKIFLFTPAMGARPDRADAKRKDFDPATATLEETWWYNVWGYSIRERTLIGRTAILASAVFANTLVETYATVEGVEAAGAVIWAGIWALAVIVTSSLMSWVGQVEEVKV